MIAAPSPVSAAQYLIMESTGESARPAASCGARAGRAECASACVLRCVCSAASAALPAPHTAAWHDGWEPMQPNDWPRDSSGFRGRGLGATVELVSAHCKSLWRARAAFASFARATHTPHRPACKHPHSDRCSDLLSPSKRQGLGLLLVLLAAARVSSAASVPPQQRGPAPPEEVRCCCFETLDFSM